MKIVQKEGNILQLGNLHHTYRIMHVVIMMLTAEHPGYE